MRAGDLTIASGMPAAAREVREDDGIGTARQPLPGLMVVGRCYEDVHPRSYSSGRYVRDSKGDSGRCRLKVLVGIGATVEVGLARKE